MEVIKYLYNNLNLKHSIRDPYKFVYNLYYYLIVPDKVLIKKRYKKYLGVYPDLKNPVTLNEKMQWLKLHDRTPLHRICADKYKAREYIKEKVDSNNNKASAPFVKERQDVIKGIKNSMLRNYGTQIFVEAN